jgi:hypothetical protein
MVMSGNNPSVTRQRVQRLALAASYFTGRPVWVARPRRPPSDLDRRRRGQHGPGGIEGTGGYVGGAAHHPDRRLEPCPRRGRDRGQFRGAPTATACQLTVSVDPFQLA